MKKKIMQLPTVCLEPKIIEQVKLCFFSKAILNGTDRFNELSEKEDFLTEIGQDFQSFLARYKQNPKDELLNLFSLQPNEVHSVYNLRDVKILRDKLLERNKAFKKKIINRSLKPIAEPWVELFKNSMLDFLKWGPSTLIMIGFIKAFILSKFLGFSLAIPFSLQDYWDYGIADSTGFIYGIIGLAGSFYSQFYLVEFAGFNYLKPAEERYKPIIEIPKFSELLIPNLIITIFLILSFILPYLWPSSISIAAAFFTSCVFYLPFSVMSLIRQYTYKLIVRISILSVFFCIIFNLWIIPKTVDPKFPEFHSKTIVSPSIDLPPDTFYVESSTKYHIFTNGKNTFLIPTSNINYITK